MPLYDMKCDSCGHEEEVLTLRISDSLPDKCPECGKKKFHTVISQAPAFHTTYSPMHPRVNRGRGH